jgi:hypothetical protein
MVSYLALRGMALKKEDRETQRKSEPMKKTTTAVSLAIVLFAGLSGTAQAKPNKSHTKLKSNPKTIEPVSSQEASESTVSNPTTIEPTSSSGNGFKLSADVVSSYVWRGGELGDSSAIQPALSYTFPGLGIVVGAWGSYGIKDTDGSRYKETDLYVTVPAGPFSMTVTDYYVSTNTSRTFDFSSTGPNVVECSVGYAKDNLSLLAAINVAGNHLSNAKYLEAGCKIYDKDKYTAKAIIGAGDEAYSKPGKGFNLVNVGFTVSKENYSASYIYNPATEKSNLVFTASF